MKAYTVEQGIVAPLDRANVDTDLIIPKQFLKSIKRTGFGDNLFDELRYLDEGYPGQDNSVRPKNPDFVLNQPRYQGATVLIARTNFGCGSSREHAPWALNELVSVLLLHQVLGIFSLITVLKTACCQSFCLRTLLISYLKNVLRMKVIN